MQSRVTRVVWDPHPNSQRFLSSSSVAGNASELRLYELDRGQDRFRTVASYHEPAQLRALAWSSHPEHHDLVATGTSSGKIALAFLDQSTFASNDQQSPRTSSKNLVVHSRSCSALAFGLESDSSLLAVGLEKGKGQGLHIYDISASLTNPRSTQERFRRGSQSDSPPLLQLAPAEGVSSLAFSFGPSTLWASVGKTLRLYDLRSAGTPAVSWTTRAVHGVRPNPFDPSQAIAHSDDGVLSVFDVRNSSEAMLSFSDADAGVQAGRNCSAVHESAWHPSRPGLYATLHKDSDFVRLWHLLEGSNGQSEKRENWTNHSRRGTSQSELPIRQVVLADDSTTPAFARSIHSFAFAGASTGSSITLLGLSKDSSMRAGHAIEVLHSPHRQHGAMLEAAVLLTDDGEVDGFRHLAYADDPAAVASNVMEPKQDDGRGRSTGFHGSDAREREDTPKPGSQRARSSSRAARQEESAETFGGLGALGQDTGAILRERLEAGYGSSAAVNATVASESQAFWQWIGRADELSRQDAILLDFDFRFRGVLQLLTGFASSSSPHSRSARPSPAVRSSSSLYNDITRALRRGDETRAVNDAYAQAASRLVERRNLESLLVVAGGQLVAQRKLALQCCGIEYEIDAGTVANQLFEDGDAEGAARHAFFAGQLEKSMSYLSRAEDERLRILAPVLASYIAQNAAKRGTDGAFAELCRSLSSDSDTPWIRALFAFLASGDWRELVEESGLPLKERVAVAFRFLPDSVLLRFLHQLGVESLASGDLDGVLLLGLRDDGVTLLSNHVDRTADLQTVAIASTFVYPGIARDDVRLHRWIETYRSLLDNMELYFQRANFDGAHGRRMRAAQSYSSSLGRAAEAEAVTRAMRKAAPAQILLRCQFCTSNVRPPRHGDGEYEPDRSVCPTCTRSLPACAICLERPIFGGRNHESICWCQRCRHGGHVGHMLEWFDGRSDVCPVAGCDCRCRESD